MGEVWMHCAIATSKSSQFFGKGHWHKSSAGTEGPLALRNRETEKAHGTDSHGTKQAVQISDPAATIIYDRPINAIGHRRQVHCWRKDDLIVVSRSQIQKSFVSTLKS